MVIFTSFRSYVRTSLLHLPYLLNLQEKKRIKPSTPSKPHRHTMEEKKIRNEDSISIIF
jgi:hypothetical protein